MRPTTHEWPPGGALHDRPASGHYIGVAHVVETLAVVHALVPMR